MGSLNGKELAYGFNPKPGRLVQDHHVTEREIASSGAADERMVCADAWVDRLFLLATNSC